MTGDIVRDLFNDRLEVQNVFSNKVLDRFLGTYDSYVITRFLLAPNDVLTPFELRAQIFRVNVELSAYNHGQKFFRKNVRK